MTYRTDVYAQKVDYYYDVVTDEYMKIGTIEGDTLADLFIKALRLYNKNANRHITHPVFKAGRYWYGCAEYGVRSKTGRGWTYYWSLNRMVGGMNSRYSQTYQYILNIPKNKVKEKDAKRYLE